MITRDLGTSHRLSLQYLWLFNSLCASETSAKRPTDAIIQTIGVLNSIASEIGGWDSMIWKGGGWVISILLIKSVFNDDLPVKIIAKYLPILPLTVKPSIVHGAIAAKIMLSQHLHGEAKPSTNNTQSNQSRYHRLTTRRVPVYLIPPFCHSSILRDSRQCHMSSKRARRLAHWMR